MRLDDGAERLRLEKFKLVRYDLRPISAPDTSSLESTSSHLHVPNGISNPLNECTACASPFDTTPNTANTSGTARDAPPPPETTVHVYPAGHALRRKLFYSANHKPSGGIQKHKGYTEYTIMEPQFPEAVERGGG